jgi:hypothetical protein
LIAWGYYADNVTEPTTTVNADDGIMDFSSGRKSIKFRVDDDIFEAAPDIAAELALQYSEQVEKLDDQALSADAQRDAIHALFRMVLFPESADKFIARLSDQRNPIGHEKITRITRWLFEEYGLRPTQSDAASSTGSESQDAGTSSTVTTPAVAST